MYTGIVELLMPMGERTKPSTWKPGDGVWSSERIFMALVNHPDVNEMEFIWFYTNF